MSVIKKLCMVFSAAFFLLTTAAFFWSHDSSAEILQYAPNTSGGGGGGTTLLGTSTSSANPQINGDASSGFYTPSGSTIAVSAGGVEDEQWNTLSGAVNYLSVTPGTTGIAPILAATGSDTNVGLYLSTKGTGGVSIGSASSGTYKFEVVGSASNTAAAYILGASTSTSTSFTNLNVYSAPAPASSSTATYNNIYSSIQYNSASDSTGNLAGIKAIAEDYGQGSVNQAEGILGIAQADANGGSYNASASLYGGRFEADLVGTSSFNHVIAAKFDAPTNAGTIAYASGVYIQDQTAGNTGTITTQDALHIEGSGLQNAITWGNGSSGINANLYSPSSNALVINASSGISIGTTTLYSGQLAVAAISSLPSSALNLNAGGNTQAQISYTGNGYDYIDLAGSSSGGTPAIYMAGSDSNIPFTLESKGSSSHVNFATNGTSNIQVEVTNTSSAVDYLTFTGAATTSIANPAISVAGTDTNINLNLSAKGSGGIVMGATQTPADNAACTAGSFYWDASYIYVCTASGTVKRAALSTY